MVNFIYFPIFTGVSGDLRPWISWLEDFFVRERFTEDEKMNLAQSLLEGEAESWFYIIQKTLIFYSWRELKEKLLLRFGDVADSDRIRLIAEQDRFLMKIRGEARIRRRKTTSIPEKDSIWETEPEALVPTDTITVTNWIEPRDSILATKLIPEANSDPVMVADASFEKEISCQAIAKIQNIESSSAKASLEEDESHEATLVKVEGNTTMFQISDSWKEESFTQNQVPVSKLEHSLQIHKESPHVCENFQAVVGCDELGTADQFSGFSQTSQVWEPGGVLADHVLVDFTGSDGIIAGIRCLAIGVCSGINQPIDSSRASRVWERGGLDNSIELLLHSGFVGEKLSQEHRAMHTEGWDEACDADIDALVGPGTCNFTSLPARCGWLVFDRGKNGQIQWTEIQMLSLDKEMVAVDKFGSFNNARLTVWRVLCLLGTLFWSLSFKKKKFGKNWWYKFKHSLWQSECGRELLEEELLVPETIVDIRLVDVGLSEFMIQWQNPYSSTPYRMLSTAFVSFYPTFKLEDKLIFQGGSIDMNLQAYHRKNKKKWMLWQGCWI